MLCEREFETKNQSVICLLAVLLQFIMKTAGFGTVICWNSENLFGLKLF